MVAVGLFKSLIPPCLTTQSHDRRAFKSTSRPNLLGKFYFQNRDCQLNQTLCCMWALSLAGCLRDLCYHDVLQASVRKNLL